MNKLFGFLFLGVISFALSILGGSERMTVMPEKTPEPQKTTQADDERKRLMREMAKRGGQKSVEVRRRKKAEREALKATDAVNKP